MCPPAPPAGYCPSSPYLKDGGLSRKEKGIAEKGLCPGPGDSQWHKGLPSTCPGPFQDGPPPSGGDGLAQASSHQPLFCCVTKVGEAPPCLLNTYCAPHLALDVPHPHVRGVCTPFFWWGDRGSGHSAACPHRPAGQGPPDLALAWHRLRLSLLGLSCPSSSRREESPGRCLRMLLGGGAHTRPGSTSCSLHLRGPCFSELGTPNRSPEIVMTPLWAHLG